MAVKWKSYHLCVAGDEGSVAGWARTSVLPLPVLIDLMFSDSQSEQILSILKLLKLRNASCQLCTKLPCNLCPSPLEVHYLFNDKWYKYRALGPCPCALTSPSEIPAFQNCVEHRYENTSSQPKQKGTWRKSLVCHDELEEEVDAAATQERKLKEPNHLTIVCK